MTIPENHDCGGDAAAFVLRALDPEEAKAFVAHLASCAICRDEVAALQRVADALPMAATQYVTPKALRRRVLAAVRADFNQAQRAGGQRFPWLRLPMPVLAAAAAAVLAVAIVGIATLASGGSGGVRVIHATVAASSASAEVRLAGGHAELIVRNLPAPPPGHIYEVWLKRPDRAPSPTSTLFSVTSSGAGEVGLPGSLRGISEVLVTPEPTGGSLVPTHQPVIAARLD